MTAVGTCPSAVTPAQQNPTDTSTAISRVIGDRDAEFMFGSLLNFQRIVIARQIPELANGLIARQAWGNF
jgi:hypothetical protein